MAEKNEEELVKELKRQKEEIERLKTVEEEVNDLRDKVEDAKAEAERVREEAEADAEELKRYRENGQSVEEQNEARIKEAEEKTKKAESARKIAEDKLIAREKAIQIEGMRAKIKSEFPEVHPSWIQGETEEAMRKSAEIAKTSVDEIYEKRKKAEIEEGKGKWDKGPGPGGGGSGPVGEVTDEDLEKKRKEAAEKGDVSGMISNIFDRAKRVMKT